MNHGCAPRNAQGCQPVHTEGVNPFPETQTSISLSAVRVAAPAASFLNRMDPAPCTSLPTDMDCTRRAMNMVLHLCGIDAALSLKALREIQDRLRGMNRRARPWAYGEEHKNFTFEVILNAVRSLLPEHVVTARVLNKLASMASILKDIAESLQKPESERGDRIFLVDGQLNGAWWPDLGHTFEESRDHPQEWRHMLVLYEKTGKMYDYQNGSYDVFDAIDLENNTRTPGGLSDAPTLCNCRGELISPRSEWGTPYMWQMNRIYSIDV